MARMKLTAESMKDVLARVKLLSLDVDGVLTDGGLYYSDGGSVSRKFNVKDGMGMKMAQAAGVKLAVISAGSTLSIRHRAEALGVDFIRFRVEDKLATLRQICAEMGIGPEESAHMGDDVNDVPVLEVVGCPLSVADAMPAARDAALFVTEKKGGEGAVREICDMIVAARQ